MSNELISDEEFRLSLAAVSETQLNAADLGPDGVVWTVRGFKVNDDPRQKWCIYLEEWRLPWKPPVTTRRVLAEVWGKPRADWIGRKVHLYRDPEITFGKGQKAEKVGGVRFKAVSHIAAPVTVTVQAGRGRSETHRIGVIPVETPKPAPSFEDRRAALAQKVEAAGRMADMVELWGAVEAWDADACKDIASRLRGGGG